MAKKKKVSGKTHTRKQLNDYANQNNPNNKAYRANKANKRKSNKKCNPCCDLACELEWFCYSNPYDFD